MKKIICLFAAASLLTLNCMAGDPYKINGKITGAADGDTVFLQSRGGRNMVKIQSAVVKKGTFVMKGEESSPVVRYLTYAKADKKMYVDFFLEKGNINVTLGEKDFISGTPSNDIYQDFKTKNLVFETQMMAIYNSMKNSNLSDEQKNAKRAEMQKLDGQQTELVMQTMEKNITNAVGIYLLKMSNSNMEIDKLEAILAKIPADIRKSDDIARIDEFVSKSKATSIGNKFVDFEMLTPEGKAIKLSDHAGKGKYVIIDFWASWCGPCRKEMPNLVKAYELYKDKGLEIVGVSLDKDAKSWTGALKQLNMTWVQMSDLKYWDCEGSKLYAVRGIPHLVLLDKDGTIIAKGLHGEELQKKLAELMK